jgi:hypothetical protein
LRADAVVYNTTAIVVHEERDVHNFDGRGETITNWFKDRGVKEGQVHIINNKNNYNKTANVTGELKSK